MRKTATTNAVDIKDLVKKEDSPLEIGTIKANEVIESIVNDFKKGIDFAVIVKGKKPTLLIPGQTSWLSGLT